MLLDVMLPDESGYDVCRQLVLTGGGAAVAFRSARDEVSDRIRGFGVGVGADDCVAKPFSLEEVLARVRAVLLPRGQRRRGAHHAQQPPAAAGLDTSDVPSGAPSGMPSGGPGGAGGGAMMLDEDAQAALVACGITMPSRPPAGTATPAPSGTS